MWWPVLWAVAISSGFRVDRDSGIGGRVTAQWPVLVVSLPPPSIIVCLLSLLIEPMAAGKVAFFRAGTGFRLMPSLCFLWFGRFFTVSGPASRRYFAYRFRSFEPLSGFCRPSIQDRSALAAPLPSSAPGLLHALSSCLEALQWFAQFLACLGAWLVSSLCVVTVPPVVFASAGGIVLGVGALVRVIQCWTFMSPRLQVSVLSLEEGHRYLSALKGYWSIFSSLFMYKLPEFRVGFVLWNLIHSFEVTLVGPPS